MKEFVFVLMPFSADFDDIYKLGIKSACKYCNLLCERVDEQIYNGSMLERIYNQIKVADYIIADMTTQNPNVFYEVGYAHALNKKTILITQNPEDIPFDMKHYYHIIYKNGKISQLQENLIKRIQFFMIDSESYFHNLINSLKVFVNDKELNDKPVDIIYKNNNKFKQLKISFQNTTEEIVECKDIFFDLIFSNKLGINPYLTKNIQNNKQFLGSYDLSTLSDCKYFVPFGGRGVDFELEDENFDYELGRKYSVEIKLYNNKYSHSYYFNIIFE